MRKIIFTWNGPMSQARAFTNSVNRTNGAKAEKAKRAELWETYKVRKEIEDSKREEFWRGYFREAV